MSPAKADDDLLTRIAAANPETSKNLRIRCASCHTFGEGESNRVGPNLWNIVERPIASVVGFKYLTETFFFNNFSINWCK